MVRIAHHSSIILMTCGFVAGAALSPAIAAPAKPLVIVFANPPEETASAPGITVTQQSPDGLLNTQRTQIATRAVRDRFGESSVAEAILYNPEAPVFVRALLEAKLQLKDPVQPTPEERRALGKAIGAVSLILVRAQPLKEKPGSVEVILESTDVESGKTWSDTVVAGSVLATLPVNPTVEGGQQKSPVDNTAWMSASNTLVLRYLAGPLGEYTRALAPPGMVNIQKQSPPVEPISPAPPFVTPTPPVPTPAPANPPVTLAVPGPTAFPSPPLANPTPISKPAEIDATALTQLVQTARQQADALVASGDTNSAIVVLRKAVNNVPRSLVLRAALAKAYLSSGRTNEAAAEARRALTVTEPNSDRVAWADLTRVLASASTEIGDNKAARNAYEEILKTQPQDYGTRLALGDLLLAQGDTAGAEKEYRTVREADPTNRAAVLSLARVLISRGNFAGAIEEVRSASNASSPQERLAIDAALFDDVTAKTADSVVQNRQAFDSGQLSREAFFKATQAQSARVDTLLSLLRSHEPPTGSPEGIVSPYRHRVSAAALLSQAVGSMLSFLESDDTKAGEQAKLLLSEFRKELSAASG
ncbi:MAG: tetratricopeptide repeat protein [Armatimonadota bacterium]